MLTLKSKIKILCQVRQQLVDILMLSYDYWLVKLGKESDFRLAKSSRQERYIIFAKLSSVDYFFGIPLEIFIFPQQIKKNRHS